jgi:hypothetical protein
VSCLLFFFLLVKSASALQMFRDAEKTKSRKHFVLNGATNVALVMSTFGELGPDADGFLQTLADVACSTGVVDRGMCLRISRQYLICALVGRGIVFRYHNCSLASSAGRDFRDGAVVTLSWVACNFRSFAFLVLALPLTFRCVCTFGHNPTQYAFFVDTCC